MKSDRNQAQVGVVMGSRSDWETLQHAVEMLDKLGVAHEVRVVSAHRTPDLLLSIVQMPAGIPVATFAIGTAGACNAALFAAAMLAAEHPDIAERVKKFRSE